MDIAGEYIFDVAQEIVWGVLHDPRALGLIVPMAMNVKKMADNQYNGTLFFRAGSIAGKFDGTIELLNLKEPTSYDIKVHGTSSVGVVDINGGINLETQDKRTVMRYQGTIYFGGRVATVGARVLELAVRSIMRQSFEALSLYFTVKYKKP